MVLNLEKPDNSEEIIVCAGKKITKNYDNNFLIIQVKNRLLLMQKV